LGGFALARPPLAFLAGYGILDNYANHEISKESYTSERPQAGVQSASQQGYEG
jgi:hypothetical protein